MGVLINDEEFIHLSGDLRLSGLNLASALAMGSTFYDIARQRMSTEAPRPISTVTLRAPIPRSGKIPAVGLNYHEDIEEPVKLGMAVPEVPMVFTKASPLHLWPAG